MQSSIDCGVIFTAKVVKLFSLAKLETLSLEQKTVSLGQECKFEKVDFCYDVIMTSRTSL